MEYFSRMPPPPGVPSPLAWSDEAHVKALLGPAFSNHRFEYDDCPDCMESPEAMADFFIAKFGPTNRAYHAQSPEKAAAFRRELIELYRTYVTPADGSVRFGREYVITLAKRRLIALLGSPRDSSSSSEIQEWSRVSCWRVPPRRR